MSRDVLNLADPTAAGLLNIAWEEMDFPDGQPGLKLLNTGICSLVEIRCRITSPRDLMMLELAVDVLRRHHPNRPIDITIFYLMGGRMDRPIDRFHPFTLAVVARRIRALEPHKVTVFDPHSDVTPALLNAKVWPPDKFVAQAISRLGGLMVGANNVPRTILVSPDAGASKKTERLAAQFGLPMIQCLKHRDMETGALSHTEVLAFPGECIGKRCLIVDDICDGGGTFTPIADQLHNRGATRVELYVSHGIFSKGLPLEGIDHVYTTDSYSAAGDMPIDPSCEQGLTVFPL